MGRESVARKDVRTEDTWDLSALCESVEVWNRKCEEVKELIAKTASYKGHICESADTLFDALEAGRILDEMMGPVFAYAARNFDQDQGDSEAKAMYDKIRNISNEAASETSYIAPEILEAGEEKVKQFMAQKPELKLYERTLELILRRAGHTLTPEMEKLVALSAPSRGASAGTYSILANADMPLPEITDGEGNTVRLTYGQYSRLMESHNREDREKTYKALYKAYKSLANTFASLYDGQLKSLQFNARAHKYASNVEAALFPLEIPVSVYHSLIDTVNANMDKLHRYVNLRKKVLKVDELHMYDMYVPMVEGVEKEYSFEEAKELSLKALLPLGEDYVNVLKDAYKSRWIDIYENKGKRSGAYSSTVYGVHPYVLLNYNGTLGNVFTLVHEMGHSMHSYLSNSAQSSVNANYRIFVAEVASTCNEILLLEHMLKECSNKEMRIYLLNHYVDMFKSTVFRQTQFAEFELETNAMEERGESINAGALCRLYKEINRKYYGPEVAEDNEIEYEWERIPHFYYNFYVYQYATSFCAAVSIAHRIIEQGEPMVKKYMDFLSSGCSLPAIELLKKVDVNMETAEPFTQALEVMGKVVDELDEALRS